jgi:hypothetical protein
MKSLYLHMAWVLIFVIGFLNFPSNAKAEGEPYGKVASLFISEDTINEQIALHSKSKLVKDMKVSFEPQTGIIHLRGLLQVPTEEMRAINLDPELGAFRFQVSIKPEVNKKGYLILEFPLAQTYFYPANSKGTEQDRVVVPVQMLSLALASIRGYLAALSGDFTGFNRRTEKLKTMVKNLDRLIAKETNPDVLDEYKTQRESLRIQLAAIPIERKQLETVSKEVSHLLSFTGEKELNLNEELGARKNALVFKIKISQFLPYLNGVELGGFRVVHDNKDGHGENFFAIDINSQLAEVLPPEQKKPAADRPAMKVPPSLIVRLNQALFESESLVEMEKKKLGSKLEDFRIDLRDDGIHVSGKFHKFFLTLPFETTVDLVTTGTDVFEARVRELQVAGLDLEFLTGFVLEGIKNRLGKTLGKICTFKNLGEEKDRARALEVRVDTKALVPAFPDFHLVEVDVREREFLLKIGHVEAVAQK